MPVDRDLERLITSLAELAARVRRIPATSADDAVRLADEAEDIVEYAVTLRSKPAGMAVMEATAEVESIREHVEALERTRGN